MDNTIYFELHFIYTFCSLFANSHAAKIGMTKKKGAICSGLHKTREQMQP